MDWKGKGREGGVVRCVCWTDVGARGRRGEGGQDEARREKEDTSLHICIHADDLTHAHTKTAAFHLLLQLLLLTIVNEALSQHAPDARAPACDKDCLARHVKETAYGERRRGGGGGRGGGHGARRCPCAAAAVAAADAPVYLCLWEEEEGCDEKGA